MKYRIFERYYCDEYGNINNHEFLIKISKTFFGLKYWKFIKHRECGWGDCYNVPTKFNSEEKAREFIQNILCKNIPRQEWISTPIKDISCK